MSIDNSLKSGSGLVRHRNVLSRAERITKLESLGKFAPDSDSALGLPKVANRKIAAGGKSTKKAKKDEDKK